MIVDAGKWRSPYLVFTINRTDVDIRRYRVGDIVNIYGVKNDLVPCRVVSVTPGKLSVEVLDEV